MSQPYQHEKHVLFWSKSRKLGDRVLSNFYPATVEYRGVAFHSIEAAFQAAKYLYSSNPEAFTEFTGMSALEARRAGSKEGMRERNAVLDVVAWDTASATVMRELVQARKATDKTYRDTIDRANADGVALYHFERSGARSKWGGCFKNGVFVGGNMLGKILMTV